jgi:tight adherence protein B
MSSSSPPSGDAALAAHVHRLAVLVSAGLSPRAAWGHVAKASPDVALRGVAEAIAHGVDIGDALQQAGEGAAGPAWCSLSAAWRVATTSGAPLAPALRGFADGLRDREAARRDIEVALAGPRATARIVMVLPAVAVCLALVIGVDLLATLTTPVGAASIGAGVALIAVARVWMRRLLRAAAPPAPTVGLALDLLAVAAGGGGSPEAAAALVEAELDRAGLAAAGDGAARGGDAAAMASLVLLSRDAGAPLGELARSDAIEARATARAAAQHTAERLAVRLMMPLGACILPSFLLLGVVPMLIGLLSSTALDF